MININSVTLVGRITKDIELRKTSSNTSVCNFTVAVDRRFQSQQANSQSADFINCIAWRQSADFLASYAQKGTIVGVEGRIQTRSYDGANGKVYVTEVVADRLSLISSSKRTGSERPSGGTSVSRDDISKAIANADPMDLTYGFDSGDDAGITADDLPF